MTKLVKSGELAKKAGVLKSTVSFYVDKGLLEPEEVTATKYRYFEEGKALKRIARIKKMQTDKRLTIEEIKQAL